MKSNPSFYEIQKREKRKSLLLFIPLVIVYLLVVTFLVLPVFLIWNPFHSILIDAGIITGIALIIALCHWTSALLYGSQTILNRLSARKPDPADRYHKQYGHVVQEIRLASGLPAVHAFVIPSWVYNSMALVDRRNGPVVAVTEGMLSDFSRSELQGAVAHELAHVVRGDSFFIGLIASLTNFFHDMADTLRPRETETPEDREADAGISAYAFMLKLASAVMRLFSSFVSRKRELLADSTAVEMTRNPLALARAVYKAHTGYSFLGNGVQGYSPLFIVSPKSRGLDAQEGFLSNLFSTHPPVISRVMPLLHMAKKPFSVLQEAMEKHRVQLDPSVPREHSRPDSGIQSDLWKIRTSKNIWTGPYTLQDIVAMPWFTLATPVRLISGNPGPYSIPREYLERGVRAKYLRPFVDRLSRRGKKQDFTAGSMLCPVCGSALDNGYYEGVPVRICRECEGRLCREDTVFRILTRQDIAFSDTFKKMAGAWKAKNRLNPLTGRRARSDLWCPSCGMPMTRRNYSVQYFIEIDTCYFCGIVWFDRNELEILQILVEEAKQLTDPR